MIIDANDPCPCGSGLRFKLCCQEEGNHSRLNSPEELISLRFQALASGDFEQLYASYHPESPFLSQFADRSSYVRFAREQLSGINLISWQALGCRFLPGNRVEQLLVMELAAEGGGQFLFELALLVKTGAGWRYHSAQKLNSDDYLGPPEQIDFQHFDTAPQKIRY